MSLLLLIALGLLIGSVLGALGGGEAILTVPALVYVVGQAAQDATTSSLVIVGITSVVGTLSYVNTRQVRWRLALAFGVAGLPAAYPGTQLNHQVDQHLLLLAFSVVMLIAATGMLRDKKREPTPEDGDPPRRSQRTLRGGPRERPPSDAPAASRSETTGTTALAVPSPRDQVDRATG